jgi:hypothetical protein
LIKNKTASILLSCVLGLSIIPLFSANFASASTGAVNFLPNYFYPEEGTFDTDNEITLSLSTAQYITAQLATKYPSSYFSAYGTTCTLSNYRTVTSYLQNNYDYVVFYSKGHRGIGGSHIALIDHYNENFYDLDIGTRTSYSKNRVTFIWHCESAEYYNYGGPNTDPLGRAIGMPYAFTHNHYLVEYGSSGTQVFLGWANRANFVLWNGTTLNIVASPQYEWQIAATNYNYADVAKQFWLYMCQGDTVSVALNKVSNTIYGTTFTSGDLYNWLLVYGNLNRGLPSA